MHAQKEPLVIFDCDGVLIDSEPLANAQFIHCLKEEGFDVDSLYGERFHGIALPDCLAILERDFKRGVSENFEQKLADSVHREMRLHLQPMPGIKEALEQLPQQKCVASGSDHERLQVSLGITGLLPYFKHIYSASDVANGKPAPDIFLYAAEQLGFAPLESVVIEDSHPGMQAGLAAGMKVFLYNPNWTDKYPVHERVTVFHNMHELPVLINNWWQAKGK